MQPITVEHTRTGWAITDMHHNREFRICMSVQAQPQWPITVEHTWWTWSDQWKTVNQGLLPNHQSGTANCFVWWYFDHCLNIPLYFMNSYNNYCVIHEFFSELFGLYHFMNICSWWEMSGSTESMRWSKASCPCCCWHIVNCDNTKSFSDTVCIGSCRDSWNQKEKQIIQDYYMFVFTIHVN